jgi:hypothetical protein
MSFEWETKVSSIPPMFIAPSLIEQAMKEYEYHLRMTSRYYNIMSEREYV